MPRKGKGKEVEGRQVDNSKAVRPQVTSRQIASPQVHSPEVDNSEAVASSSAATSKSITTNPAPKKLQHILSSPALHHMKMTVKLEGLKKARKDRKVEKEAHPLAQTAQPTQATEGNLQEDKGAAHEDKAHDGRDKEKPQPQPPPQNMSDRARGRPTSNREEVAVPVAPTSYPAEEAIREIRNRKRGRANTSSQAEAAGDQAAGDLEAQAPARPVRPIAKARKVAEVFPKAQVQVTTRSGRVVKPTLRARERESQASQTNNGGAGTSNGTTKKAGKETDKNLDADKEAYKEARKEVTHVASSDDEQAPRHGPVNQESPPNQHHAFVTLKASDRPVGVGQPDSAHAQAGSRSHPQAGSSQAEDLPVRAPVPVPVPEPGTEVPRVVWGTPVPKPGPVANAPEVPRIILGTPMPAADPAPAAEPPTVTLGTPLATPSGTPTRTTRGGRVVRPTWKLRGD